METYFAPAERADEALLRRQISYICNNPVINGIVSSVNGLLAVLNEERQVLTVNNELLSSLGVDDPAAIHGLRPGEFIQCIHSHEPPHGCGTTPACLSCGAVIAMVSSLTQDRPVERTCAVTSMLGGVETDLYFQVRSTPLTLEEKRFLLLFLRDITREHCRASLERIFFHDINNFLTAMMGMSELLLFQKESEGLDLPKELNRLAERMAKEVDIQRLLVRKDFSELSVDLQEVDLKEVLTEIGGFFLHHESAAGKRLVFPVAVPSVSLKSDSSLIIRVLNNLLINAFEAGDAGDEVRLGIDMEEGAIVFSVWNRKVIPEHLAGRIFQQHFSTKSGEGRGFGTYSVKLIGESLLGGRVGFSSSEAEGTLFRLSLPVSAGKG
jgi:signal transduction histidine kinase